MRNPLIRDRTEIKTMFDRLSGHYDLLNRMITFGFDSVWRRHVIQKAALCRGARLLDVGAGTGDIAFSAIKKEMALKVAAADFSLGMIEKGRMRKGGHHISWCAADALNLPFADKTFDTVTSGYLIRNVLNPLNAFREQLRVLKPGGRVVCLETSPPKRNFLRPIILIHFNFMIPLLGRLVGGNRAAYTYLPDTTKDFMKPQQMVTIMEKAGFEAVDYRLFMFGTMAIHWGRRPDNN